MKVLLIASLMVCATAASAQTTGAAPSDHLAGQSVECSAFRHDADGSWVALQPLPVQRQNEFTQIATGTTIRSGGPKIAGLDVGRHARRGVPEMKIRSSASSNRP